MNNKTLNRLKLQHPKPKKADKIADTAERIHAVKFELIDTELIRKANKNTRGNSGPSGMDADCWRHILLSKRFRESSSNFLAKVVKKLTTEDSRT